MKKPNKNKYQNDKKKAFLKTYPKYVLMQFEGNFLKACRKHFQKFSIFIKKLKPNKTLFKQPKNQMNLSHQMDKLERKPTFTITPSRKI